MMKRNIGLMARKTRFFMKDSFPIIGGVIWRIVCLDVPILIVYVCLRALGTSPYKALGVTMLCAIGQMVISSARRRNTDIFLVAMIAIYGLGAFIAFVTKNAQYALLGQVAPSAVLAIWFMISAWVYRPVTLIMTQRYFSGFKEHDLRAKGWREASIDAYIHVHKKISLIVGSVELCMSGIVIAVIFLWTADAAMAVNEMCGSAVTLSLAVYSVRRIHSTVRHYSARIKGAGSEEQVNQVHSTSENRTVFI